PPLPGRLRSGEQRGPETVEHRLLAIADLLRAESHEAAVLGGIRGRLGGGDQPVSERRGLLRRRPSGDEVLNLSELLDDLLTGRRTAGRLVALQWVVPLLGQGLELQGDLRQQLFTGGRVGGRPDRRHGLLGRLDRAARVGKRDREARNERCPHDPCPLILRGVALRGHQVITPPEPPWAVENRTSFAYVSVLPLAGV